MMSVRNLNTLNLNTISNTFNAIIGSLSVRSNIAPLCTFKHTALRAYKGYGWKRNKNFIVQS